MYKKTWKDSGIPSLQRPRNPISTNTLESHFHKDPGIPSLQTQESHLYIDPGIPSLQRPRNPVSTKTQESRLYKDPPTIPIHPKVPPPNHYHLLRLRTMWPPMVTTHHSLQTQKRAPSTQMVVTMPLLKGWNIADTA